MLRDHRQQTQALSQITDPQQRRAASEDLRRERQSVTDSSARALLTQWLASQVPASEPALVWFWFNHFNVFWNKGLVGAAVPSYIDEAIRPHVRGRFADLLVAVITHPAMLIFLDNTGNTADMPNENLAREMLELHTLGANSGYTQADVRETARLLTGFGLRPLNPVRWPAQLQPLVQERGEFLFDPRRHDFAVKTIIGRRYAGVGFGELQSLCEWLSVQPATAQRIVGRLATYLTGDTPQPNVLTKAQALYIDSGGDLGVTTDLLQQALVPSAGSFKTPLHWLLDATRLLAGGRPVTDASLLLRWLSQLGQPMFGCTTPDGYALRGTDWTNAGQFTQRFEIAPQLVSRQEQVFGSAQDANALMESVPALALRAKAGPATLAALARSRRASEQLALLLSSPEFMYR